MNVIRAKALRLGLDHIHKRRKVRPSTQADRNLPRSREVEAQKLAEGVGRMLPFGGRTVERNQTTVREDVDRHPAADLPERVLVTQ